jgi:hypothetical protein
MNLLPSFGKQGVNLNLLSKKADVIDNEYLSKYFVLNDFSPILTAGKNSISFNGSELLKQNSEILVECLDSNGNNLFIEMARIQNVVYKEAGSYIISVYVFGDTYNGAGKLILYGTTTMGNSVKWIGNIVIDKTKYNTSVVRFYDTPILEVKPIQVAYIKGSETLVKNEYCSGSFYGYAVNPQRGANKVYTSNIEIDYRIVSNTGAKFNSQIIGFPIDLNIKSIRDPQTYSEIQVNSTSSFVIKDVINESTLKLTSPFTYEDLNKNKLITDIVTGSYLIQYPFVTYSTGSEENIIIKTTLGPLTLKQSIAEITYRNIKTFSGYIARHKLYRKSLFSPGDFEVIADEPLGEYNLLTDTNTLNKKFNDVGHFYNQFHIEKYWFTSSVTASLTYTSENMLDSMVIKAMNNPETEFTGSIYVVTKNDSEKTTNRDASYIPYNSVEYLDGSGSSYDSNYISLKKNVQYVLSFNVQFEKPSGNGEGGVYFYFTSSLTDVVKDVNYTVDKGIKIAEYGILFSEKIKKIDNIVRILYTPTTDLYGTLVIYPYLCNVTLSNLSFKTYGDDGFSPDVLTTRIPFPIKVPNEAFEIKAELFDVNSNLVYSNLRLIKNFDEFGETITAYQPGYAYDPSTLNFLSGSLVVSQSLEVGDYTVIHSGSLIRLFNMERDDDATYDVTMKNPSVWPDDVGTPFMFQRPSPYPLNTDPETGLVKTEGKLYYTPKQKFSTSISDVDNPWMAFKTFNPDTGVWDTIGYSIKVSKIRERIYDAGAGWPEDALPIPEIPQGGSVII